MIKYDLLLCIREASTSRKADTPVGQVKEEKNAAEVRYFNPYYDHMIIAMTPQLLVHHTVRQVLTALK